MNSEIIIGLLLTLAPVSELRGGLPVIVNYCLKNGISVWPYFLVVLILNILLIFFIFGFFDFFHKTLMNFKLYRNAIGHTLKRLHKKAARVEGRMNKWGYLALMFFVAVPLPGTGAWTGTMVAWALKLDRLKSFVAIATGVIIAGLLVLLFSLGLLGQFY